MGGPTSVFRDPFGNTARERQQATTTTQQSVARRDQLLATVRSEQDLTDADRQSFVNALASLSATERSTDTTFQSKPIDSKTLDALASQVADAIALQRKKREGAEKQRALINEAPGTRLTQDVNVASLGASPLVTATANPGLV